MIALWLLVGAWLCAGIGGLAALLGDRTRRVAHLALAVGFRGIVRSHPFCTFSITGAERLTPGPAVLCPNHQSITDIVYLYSLPIHFKWVIRKQVFKLPVFGTFMRFVGYVPIDRDGATELLAEVAETLRSGVSVVNFPEGTRSRSGELGRFRTGAARMAVASQVPLVPIAITGTHRLLPRGTAMLPLRSHVRIHVGEPIPTAGLGLKDVRPLTRRLREAIEAAQANALAPEA